jgi:uncharacterized protein YndB with AHSA1/START domain
MLKYLFATLLFAQPALADVKSVAENGFEVQASADIHASPDRVFAALGKIGQWWTSEHTASGNAANLSLSLKAGGCFCEIVKGGLERQHMTVVDVEPGKVLRLRGGLGPLQSEGVDGALTWAIAPAEGGVVLTQSYVVGGYLRGGSAKWAPAVDAVLNTQLARFKSFVETGSPEAAAKP